MAFLYINHRGEPWHKHSYSAGLDWETSPLKYKKRRIDGWKERDTKASFKFGRALESAIQFHHENGGRGGREEFIRLWGEHKEDKTITFTPTEASWESLNRAGREMMELYALRLPTLPIPLNAIFQREYEKEVFPNHPDLGGITHAGKLDVICDVDPAHPLLPKVTWTEKMGMFRRLIVDIKTNGLDFDERQGMCAFDGQLRNYAWLTGIRDVAFLWFKKAGHNLQKGSSVTLLSNGQRLKAGEEAVVAQVLEEQAYIVKNDDELSKMETAQGRKPGIGGKPGDLETTKEAKGRKAAWLALNADLVEIDTLTRQRLQFNAGIVKQEYADDAGFVVGRQITEIVNARKSGRYPMEFGVRFPHDSRKDSYFRAFVEDDKLFREQFFTLSDSSFDDLLVQDEDPEEN